MRRRSLGDVSPQMGVDVLEAANTAAAAAKPTRRRSQDFTPQMGAEMLNSACAAARDTQGRPRQSDGLTMPSRRAAVARAPSARITRGAAAKGGGKLRANAQSTAEEFAECGVRAGRPSRPVATDVESTSLTLSWSPPTHTGAFTLEVIGYQVLVQTSGDSGFAVHVADTGTPLCELHAQVLV